jgi:hypothetical protein
MPPSAFENIPPGFTLSTAILERRQQNRTTFLIRVTPTGGFRDKVVFSTTGLPATVKAEFHPTEVFDNAPTYLVIVPGPATPSGAFPFTVTATSGDLTRRSPLVWVHSR